MDVMQINMAVYFHGQLNNTKINQNPELMTDMI